MPERALAEPGAGEPGPSSALSLEDVERGLAQARERLASLQDPAGHWRGLLQTNVTMDAEDLLLREFLGVRDEARSRRSAQWIRSQQAVDGSWANFAGSDGDLSTTIEAYWALRLVGDEPGAEHMRRAAGWTRARGGPRAARVFTQIWMALFGLWPWDEVPALPPELVLLPSWFPLNPYDFACWARQTIVALTIVRAHRPVHQLPFALDELGPGAPAARPAASATGRLLRRADRLARRYERHPLRRLRRRALATAERWVVERQEADGSWGGIQPPWVYSLMALKLQGYPLEHPVMRTGLRGLDAFTVDDAGGTWLEACQSPVWDTALAMLALVEAGAERDDPALVRAADWLLARQVTGVAGDWAVKRPGLAPGAWAFEFHNVNYPDVDDTAVIALALRQVVHPEPRRVGEAVRRAIDWIIGMECTGGGWGSFDADNTRGLCARIPFCDFGEVIDPPSADVTAHAVELLAAEAGPAAQAASRSGVRWLLGEQEADGSWFGRWGVNHVYGTWSALCALAAAGVTGADPRMRRAVAWLQVHQNPDGGWGEDCRSYADPAWIGRGESTASQTAWALLGLHAAGAARSASAERGIRWLLATQRPDGTWDEAQFTGTGFPGDFYINYHLYRLVFPVMALGRCLPALRSRPAGAPQASVSAGTRPVSSGAPVAPSASTVMAQARTENFPVASRLLPRRVRSHLLALYGFARLVDDAGDEAPGDRLALLDGIESDLERLWDGGVPRNPLIAGMAPTVSACGLDIAPFRRLIEAGRRDQVVHRYETIEELLGYCALSANPVGELVLEVLGSATPERVGYSDAICSGLQLAEHWQDVAEDSQRGRIYLPAVDRARFGVTEAELATPVPTPAFGRLMAFEVTRARRLLDEGAPLIRTLEGPGAFAVAAFLAGGRSALTAIERADYDVLGARPRPRQSLRAATLVTTLLRVRF